MARRESVKLAKGGLELISHRLLADVAGAVRAELLERAHLQMPGPSGKTDSGGVISLKLLFAGELQERDQRAAREVLQRLSNPAELMLLLRKHGGGGHDAGA